MFGLTSTIRRPHPTIPVANLPPDVDTGAPFRREVVAKGRDMLTGVLDAVIGNGVTAADALRVQVIRAREALA